MSLPPSNNADEPVESDPVAAQPYGSYEHDGSRLHQAMAVEELVRANADSNETMIKLVKSVREETRARDRKVEALDKQVRQGRFLVILSIVCVLFLLLIAIINATNIAKQRETSRQVQATNSLLLDCLNRQGECGRWNAEQQALLLDEVKRYELTGFYCIRNNPQVKDPNGEAFLKCVNRLYPGGPQLQIPRG